MRTRPTGPVRACGIGLRGLHFAAIREQKPPVGWLEIHPENYFGGGRNRQALTAVRADYALSFHAVGLSLGAARPVDPEHLAKIAELARLYEPFQISDHAAWSASGNAHFNDLLPLPYTAESLSRLCDNIGRAQDALGRRILVENPSAYAAFAADEMDEPHFLNEMARRSGCGLLLDVNNVYVQAHNHGFDAAAYISAINAQAVGEIHLSGHEGRAFGDGTLLIDTHASAVDDGVWALYGRALAHCGAVPTLVEWDADIPPLAVLCAEAGRAQAMIDAHAGQGHADAA